MAAWYIAESPMAMAQAMRKRLTMAPQLPLAYGLSCSNLSIVGTIARRSMASHFLIFSFSPSLIFTSIMARQSQ